jgi:hypothetical protein
MTDDKRLGLAVTFGFLAVAFAAVITLNPATALAGWGFAGAILFAGLVILVLQTHPASETG